MQALFLTLRLAIVAFITGAFELFANAWALIWGTGGA